LARIRLSGALISELSDNATWPRAIAVECSTELQEDHGSNQKEPKASLSCWGPKDTDSLKSLVIGYVFFYPRTKVAFDCPRTSPKRYTSSFFVTRRALLQNQRRKPGRIPAGLAV